MLGISGKLGMPSFYFSMNSQGRTINIPEDSAIIK